MDKNDKHPRNEIIKTGNANDISLPAEDRDKIVRGIANINNANISNVLSTIFSKAEITADAVKYIKRGTVYLAEVPKKLQKDFSDGKLKFMEKSTGELVGEIVGPNNFGNKGHVIIKDAGFLHSDIPHDLTSIAMQQQLAQMAAVLDEVRSRVEELQKTYDESLLGELRGMREQLTQIQSIDDLENQRDLIRNAITQINLTRGKITQRLLAEIQKMPIIPEKAWKSILKSFFKKDYRDNVESGYEKIQELFSYYLASSELLAFAYAQLGETRTYDDIFKPDNELLDSKKLKNLERSEMVLGICEEKWYSVPDKYLGHIKEQAQKLFISNPETITIELTGDQIMEVIEQNEKRD